jgi:uncharacterized membrane protein
MAWLEYALAFITFFVGHRVPVLPRVKPRLQAQLGETGFLIAYSVLSTLLLAWLLSASARAPFIVLWSWAPWQNGVPLLGMLLVCVLLALSIGVPNPFSFGGGRGVFDPANAGIVRWVRHPLLLALAIWSGCHVVPNGDLAHVAMFASFCMFALMGMELLDKQRQKTLWIKKEGSTTGQNWQALLYEMRVFSPKFRVWVCSGDVIVRCVIGVLVYGMLLAFHEAAFGVNPLWGVLP